MNIQSTLYLAHTKLCIQDTFYWLAKKRSHWLSDKTFM